MLGQGIDPFHMNQVPSRRSQSKNDKYKDASGDMGGGFGSLNNFVHQPGMPGGQKQVQPQVRTSQNNQRFSHMPMPGKGQNVGINAQHGIMQKR